MNSDDEEFCDDFKISKEQLIEEIEEEYQCRECKMIPLSPFYFCEVHKISEEEIEEKKLPGLYCEKCALKHPSEKENIQLKEVDEKENIVKHKRIKCSYSGCKWENEYRSYPQHLLTVHSTSPQNESSSVINLSFCTADQFSELDRNICPVICYSQNESLTELQTQMNGASSHDNKANSTN